MRFLGAIAICLSAAAADHGLGTHQRDLERGFLAALERNPRDSQALGDFVRFLGRHGRADEATVLLRGMAPGLEVSEDLLWGQTHWYAGASEAARERLGAVAPREGAAWVEAQTWLARLDWLEGRRDALLSRCEGVLAEEPFHLESRVYCARVHMGRGGYEAAQTHLRAAESAHPDSLVVTGLTADLHDAQGHYEEAAALRRAMVDRINARAPETLAEYLAGAEAMRRLGEPRAAEQCLNGALDYAPEDPFVLLEKMRLFDATSGYIVAVKTATRLIDRHPECVGAWWAYARALWQLNEDAQSIDKACAKTLEFDPELLGARCLQARLAIVSGAFDEADALLEVNREYNAAHLPTEQLALALALVRDGAAPTTFAAADDLALADGSRLSGLVAHLHTARGAHQEARSWYGFLLAHGAVSAEDMRLAGIAAMRDGNLDVARGLLEEAFARDRFSMATRNVLDLLDFMARSEVMEREGVTLAWAPRNEDMIDFAALLVADFLRSETGRFGLSGHGDLRVQFCTAQDQLDIAAEGIPISRCGTMPRGWADLGATLFAATPGASGAPPGFRFDEALHNGVTSHLLLEAFGPGVPLWLRKGLAAHAAESYNPEWRVWTLTWLLPRIAADDFPAMAHLETAYTRQGDALLRAYAALVVDDWARQYGFPRVLDGLRAIRDGGAWASALPAAFGLSLEELDRQTQARIRARFGDLLTEPSAGMNLAIVMSADAASDKAVLDRAKAYLLYKRPADALRTLGPLLDRDTPPVRACFLGGRAAWMEGDAKQAKALLQSGFALQAAGVGTAATALDHEALGDTLLSLGETDGAVSAYHDALRQAPFDTRKNGPLGRLLGIYRKVDPRPDDYYHVLRRYLPNLRDDAAARMELARWYEKRGDDTDALAMYRSAAGIRPDWTTAHRRMALLAARLGETQLAYASCRFLLRRRPEDEGLQTALLQAGVAAGLEAEARAFMAGLR